MKSIFNRIVAITNTLPNKQYVFMCEFDSIDFDFVKEQAQTIANIFGIDIDILESSKNSYHLISYDIVFYDILKKMYHWVDLSKTDFLPIDEIELFNVETYTARITQKQLPIGCALRLTEKFNKESPTFIERIFPNILVKKTECSKSFEHHKFYKIFCNVPDFSSETCFITLPAQIVIYNVGIGSKSRQGKRSPIQQKVYNKLKYINSMV